MRLCIITPKAPRGGVLSVMCPITFLQLEMIRIYMGQYITSKIILNVFGKVKSLKEHTKDPMVLVSYDVVIHRLRMGWSIVKSLYREPQLGKADKIGVNAVRRMRELRDAGMTIGQLSEVFEVSPYYIRKYLGK